ncbi:hypothetical protein AK812_SmicGene43493 [Symbiodinium microadriaticum]|uniref:Uncharacterized protein n=1 Tax=Symbiodinium microadriaticum TaxID=2951 RepID=A0A1Q9C0W7_SYMMI|nr:hypothetical protein AK812_SmicGene43493 [Symbiodinium microadriaticum]
MRDSESTSPRPLTITVNTASYTFLTGLLANMARLEDQFLWGFTQRLRRRAEEDLARTGVKSVGTGWCSDQGGRNEGHRLFCPAAVEEPRDTRPNIAEHFMTECLEESSVTKAPRFEEQLHRSPIQLKMSPKIPEALVAQCLDGDMGGGTEPAAEETAEEAPEETPAVDSREFALDSVYRIARAFKNTIPAKWERLGTMDVSIPDLAVCYSSHLDCRYLSVFSSVVSVKEQPAETRGVRISGEAFPQLGRLWPYLRNFPGLRSFAPYPEAIGHWFPEQLPRNYNGDYRYTCNPFADDLGPELPGAAATPPF